MARKLESNTAIYVRKTYSAKLLCGMLSFSITSEDRQNGEYKHMVLMKFLGRKILSLVYRTGRTNSGINTSVGLFSSGRNWIDHEIIRCDTEDANGNSRDSVWKRGNLSVEIYTINAKKEKADG